MPENLKHVLVFSSNIATEADRRKVGEVLDMHPQVQCWSVDLGDEEKVLRIVSDRLSCTHVQALVTKCGYACEELKD